MRRITLAALAIGLAISGCTKPKQKSAPPPPVYSVRPNQPTTATVAPRQSQRSPGDPAWAPRGGRISPRWTTVVLHHSATANGSARTFDRFHRDKGWDELGYHFVIGNGTETPDGFIEVGSRWHKQKHGAHCKTADNYFNEHGIGVCLVGDFTKTRPTQRQLAALERLVEYLCARCSIPPDRVVSHGAVTHKTACPGRNFPMGSLRRAVAASSMPYY